MDTTLIIILIIALLINSFIHILCIKQDIKNNKLLKENRLQIDKLLNFLEGEKTYVTGKPEPKLKPKYIKENSIKETPPPRKP
jgi:hypothetical protein